MQYKRPRPNNIRQDRKRDSPFPATIVAKRPFGPSRNVLSCIFLNIFRFKKTR